MALGKLESDINEALKTFSLLKPLYINGKFDRLRGEIEVVGSGGQYIDIFDIDIVIPPEYPQRFPFVYETGGKIPHLDSRHIIPKDNRLCLAVEIEEILICKNGITLTRFLKDVVIPRLAEEYVINQGGQYPEGREYSHNRVLGTAEYLMRLLETDDIFFITKFIDNLIQKKLPKRKQTCVCESGLNYKDCHYKRAVKLQQLGYKMLGYILKELKELKQTS